MRRAAHFLERGSISQSPGNEAIVSAYQELGLEVDLFAPGGAVIDDLGEGVRSFSAEYGKRWLSSEIWKPKWRQYSIFSGTCEDPMAIVGALSRVHGRPAVCYADEIKSGGYAGNRSHRWKAFCRSGMRKARLHVVNDPSRVQIQRSYARLDAEHQVIVVPGCYREAPLPFDRRELRRQLGIPDEAVVLSLSGVLELERGLEWAIKALDAREDLWLLAQPSNDQPLVRLLFETCRSSTRMCLEPRERLAQRAVRGNLWRAAQSSCVAADIGVVVYRSEAAQFQNMGVSSNRLCMYLTMGIPVVANRQDSFGFLEDYGCGILVGNLAEFVAAIDVIRERRDEMSRRALECVESYIGPSDAYRGLVEAIRRLLAPRIAQRQHEHRGTKGVALASVPSREPGLERLEEGE